MDLVKVLHPDLLGSMNLTIHDPEAPDLATALGISEQRRSDISKKMDEQLENYRGQAVRTSDIYSDFISICNNLEEVVYAVTIHCSFMQRHGMGY